MRHISTTAVCIEPKRQMHTIHAWIVPSCVVSARTVHTAGVQKALMAIQAPEPGVQYISLVPVAIQTPAQVVSTFNWQCSQQLKTRNAPELRGHHVIYHLYLTQRPIPLKRSMRLIPIREVSTRRARTRWRSRCAKGVCSQNGEATSVEGGHDIHVTMSARVQPSRGIDHAAPHVVVYGIMVFHPMTPSRDKLHMTSR